MRVRALRVALLLSGVLGPLGGCKDTSSSLAGHDSRDGRDAREAHDGGNAQATEPGDAGRDRDAISPKLAPLGDAAWLEPLDLGNGDAAVVAVPLGAIEPRPVMLAVHGAGDRPEWACGGWRLGTGAYPFIICPRGTPVAPSTYAWSSWQQIERVALAAIEQVRRRFGAYVAEGPVTYAGFSQGATSAAPLLLRHAADFHPIVLAEGGYAFTSSAEFARNMARHGARKVILVCGTQHCFANAARARAVLEREKLTVFVGGDASSGHNLNFPMQNALRHSWKEWFAGEPAWAGFGAARAAD